MNILDVTADKIERVYSGRPGCGCGCLGKYYSLKDNPKMVKRVLNKFQKMEREKPGLFTERPENAFGLPRIGFNTPNIFFVETEKRYYWLYVKKS
jgi:hypothetical protein